MKKLKYLGILAILPLLTLALTTDYIGEADAAKAEGSPGTVSPKSYGSANKDIVCGDKLCSELKENSSQIELVLAT